MAQRPACHRRQQPDCRRPLGHRRDSTLQADGSQHGSDRDSHRPRVGQANEQPLSPFPEGIEFPANYRISESAVFKAYHKAMDRQPAINAEVFRKEDTARCEDMFLKLQRGVSNGDPRHVEAAVRVLAHKAKLNGYAVEPEQSSGVSAFSINIRLGHEEK